MGHTDSASRVMKAPQKQVYAAGMTARFEHFPADRVVHAVQASLSDLASYPVR